eukprot:1189728-Prorocentrum_minimum.AAC.1
MPCPKADSRTWSARTPSRPEPRGCYVVAEYYSAYQALPKDVERADFFRYMVVLRHGGVYADIDTECRVPIDNYLLPSDAFVVGWENEFATDEAAYARHFVRRRQVGSISSRPSSDRSPPRIYTLVPPPIGPHPGYILSSLLRLVPTPGISSRPSSDWSPPRVYTLVPPPTGPHPRYILSSLLRSGPPR